MSPEAYVIEVFSGEWIRNTVLTILFIVTYLFFGKFLSNKNKLIFAKAISVILIFITITGHTRNIINGYWNPVDNIPLHLCSISNFIACFILFVPKISKESKFFEFLYYAGIIGAFQAFFTPQINNFDGSNYEYIEWYLSHIGIMLLPIYMLKNLGFRLTKFSWLRVVVYLNILLIIVMPINYFIGSNYMYVNGKPEVNNPLIIGEWPIYIFFWEIIIIIFTYTLYVMSTKKLK
ncbi:MAG: TIGR02206 family membrane protein [Bacteroidota bacterium]|jgi:hypothetical integral membrane protein (TIGR02206 family)|nr:TIGR02206 family membrane protein [Bacteroidota bacterium]|tara:strand:+ start:221 stop:922 length:702 start_codon:yes stop_codon:yes gene_type:complete